MNTKSIIEGVGTFDDAELFKMAKCLGISSISGIKSSKDFQEKIDGGFAINYGFDAKAYAVISAFIAKYGIEKDIDEALNEAKAKA